ncbi:MAG: hypothetical protein BGO92_16825 [Magnetospirillum sp. 64-120]|uniref:hypothetical protein n=1 Tax=Magnetospirillum sp. 64-120 TaxID=1895778 RepID=UPI00092C1A11|nr:hypothetical protein [Magnetospirillum sp. 64-120]OJX78812.1 MAG: hypothetical protein BGO92_16825 [Magnetospirillum sp. 64-120]
MKLAPRLAVLAGLIASLAACETIPRPFKHESDRAISSLARPKLGRGVALRLPDDMAGGQALANATISAFENSEVPVTLRHGPGFGRVIEVQPEASQVIWRLADADGTEMGRLTTNPGLSAKLTASQVVARFLPLLDDPDARPQLAAKDLPPPLTARLAPMKGLPGDGDQSLAQSLVKALERRGITLSDDAPYTVVGLVTITQVGSVDDMVTVSWLVKRGDAGGQQLARIDQGGSVPRDRLKLPWGSLARDISEGGAQSIAEVLRMDERNRKDQENAAGSRRFTEPGPADIGKPDSQDDKLTARTDPPPPAEPAPMTEAGSTQAPPSAVPAPAPKAQAAPPKPAKASTTSPKSAKKKSVPKKSSSPTKAKKAKPASRTKPTGTQP